MINETSPSSRRQAVLQRARQRQALIRQRTPDDILDFEQRLFAEDEQYVPQLLRAHAEAERLPKSLPQSRPHPKSLDPLPTPAPSSAYGQEGQEPEQLSEFERQHNAPGIHRCCHQRVGHDVHFGIQSLTAVAQ